MLPPPFHHALVLTGPTAAGKTQLGIEIAQQLDAEIVSMDSMTLYRGMDIGTAKPTCAERALVPHHLIDVLDPWESASVAWWLDRAADCCRDIERRGKRVLFVGGTPLYLKALLCGLFEGPPADHALRQQLEEDAALRGPAHLHARLTAVDPVSAGRIHPNDVRRMVRALEVYALTGKPLSAWQTQWVRGEESGATGSRVARPESAKGVSGPTPFADSGRATQVGNGNSVLWLDLPRAELYERIDRRVEAMFAGGFVEEVRRLRMLPRPWSREAAKALGYREVCEHLDGRIDRAATIALVQTRSRQFAKRQLTWFRHLPGCRPATGELTRTLWCRTIHG